MFGHRTLHRHAAMMNRMAEVQGLDLTAAMAKGTLSGEDWREAVLRCTGCADPEACLAWLGGREPPAAGAAPAEPAPDYCANRSMLDRLRDLSRQEVL